MQPVILLTVYRRYAELYRAVNRVWEADAYEEFNQRPDVWVLWACPEPGRAWFFRDLLRAGRVHRVLTRQELPGERNSPISYPESHNIRRGLRSIQQFYTDAYVIGQAADVLPHVGTYRWVDQLLTVGAQQAVLFHWQNPCHNEHVWHTNFFAVPLDERYWPPLSYPGHPDVLERHWGAELQRVKPPLIFAASNYNSKRFLHEHLSESLPDWSARPDFKSGSIPLFCRGRAPFSLSGVIRRWRLPWPRS